MKNDLETRLLEVETALEDFRKKPKDVWDKLTALSPILSGTLIGAIGIYATCQYNARQLDIQESQSDREISVTRVQTVEKFFPYLSDPDDDNVRLAALDAISALGDDKLALNLAERFGGRSGAEVLTRLAKSPDPTISEPASAALAEHFNRLKVIVATVVSASGATSTGFFVSPDGKLVFPSFLLAREGEEEVEISVRPYGGEESYAAVLLSRDDKAHLALLQVDSYRPVTHVQEWNEDPKLGDKALVLASIANSEWVSRAGNIVGIDFTVGGMEGRIVTDFTSSPGFSGAPVVDTSGRLIGMAESGDESGNSVIIQASNIKKFIANK